MVYMGQRFLIVAVLLSLAYWIESRSESNPDNKGIRLLQSDESGVTIEFIPRYVGGRTHQTGDMLYADYDFDGSVSLGPAHRGEPNLRYAAILVGLPTQKGNSVEIVGADYEEIRNVRVAPVPTYAQSDTGAEYLRTYTEKPDAYRLNQLTPSKIAELVEQGVFRDNIVSNLHVTPVQYNAASGVLRKYSRMVIKVRFGSPSIVGGQQPEAGDDLLRGLMINYDVAAKWKAARPARIAKVTANSVLASGDWYRIEVKDEGIYKLDANFLKSAGINISGIDPRTLKIYGNGGLELSEDITRSRPNDLVENAIYVTGEQDGSFDGGDYILFFGRGVNDWNYDPSTRSFNHYINHYVTSNYYWLTHGGSQGKRMGNVLGGLNNPTPFKPSSWLAKIFVEEEINKTDVQSGREWFGHQFDADRNQTYTYMNKLDNLVASSPMTYRFMMIARSGGPSSFKVEEGATLLGYIDLPPVFLGGAESGDYAAKSGVYQFTGSGNLADSRSLLKLTYIGNATSDKAWTDWFEIFYRRSFGAVNDVLRFGSPDTSATIEYDLSGFSNSDITGFDVSDIADVKRISNAYISGSEFRFQVQQTSGSAKEYLVAGANGYKTPVSIQKASNSNLHGLTEGADFVIVTHSDFTEEASRLKQHRESQASGNVLKTNIVDVMSIYNEFSGGLLDPTAIRDFLRYAYLNWTVRPRYVMLFGDGDYDYKNILSSDKNWIPPFETMESLHQINTYASDDYFVRVLADNPRNQMAVGRLTVRSLQEARIVLDKIVAYETSARPDPWKNRLTFVADDGLVDRGDDGTIHTDQSETLAKLHTPKEFEQKKIYLIQYRTVTTSAGRRKPDVNQAIIDQLNQGTLTINWTGHGNKDVWAHERVFQRETTIPKLNNADKLALLTAATCDFGRYDEPQDQSGAELLLTDSEGGVIAALSTDRVAYSDENADFNNAFYDRLLARNADGSPVRIGDAMLSVKQIFFSTNDSKFHILGDPTVKLAMPRYRAVIDSINGVRADSLVQLKAFGKVTIKGSVLKSNSVPWDGYSGLALMTVFDSQKELSIPDENNYVFNFTLPGGTIYKGESSITDGHFAATFYVPKDISYESNRGRIALYFQNAGTDGSGYNENITIGGTDVSVTPDSIGPDITIFLGDRNFRSGDLVNDNPRLLVDLLAEHGLNISGVGIGHKLEAWLDNSQTSIDLTDFYQGKTDSYKEGSVEYQLRSLTDGTHTIKVRAWDIFNNSSVGEASFQVASSSGLTIRNVLNYPNPFATATTFTFQQNQDSPIDIQIKIYTLSGRLIQTLEQQSVTDKFVRVLWDGRDHDGDEIANGVYFYRLMAKTQDGRFTSEEVGKMAVAK
jgi:hypothetical protein